jgi:hypothetical protein
MRSIPILPLLVFVLLGAVSAAAEVESDSTSLLEQAAQSVPSTTETWSQIQRLYEKARNESATATQNAYEWTREDLGRIGTWEYRIHSATTDDLAFLELELNRLGAERWECFHAEPSAQEGQAPKMLFFLKRPARSFLKHLPLPSLWNLFPGGETEGAPPSPGQD